MSSETQGLPPGRRVTIRAGFEPIAVVFEVQGWTEELPPWGELHLVLRGPETEVLTVGHASSGVSIFRDEGLEVEVFDKDGNPLDIGFWG